MSSRECQICYEPLEENYVLCDCSAGVCMDCFKHYTRSAQDQYNKLPSCVLCRFEYLFHHFKGDAVLRGYVEFFYEYFKHNPRLVEMFSETVVMDRAIEQAKQRKIDSINQMPRAVVVMAHISFKSRLQNVMKINTDLIRERLLKKKNCFSGICPDGKLNEYEDSFVCDTCHTAFCKQCEKAMFQGHVCREEDLTSITAMQSIKNCPGCGCPSERRSGCQYVTCSICKTKYNIETLEISDYGGHLDAVDGRKIETYKLHEELNDRDPEIIDAVRRFESTKPQVADKDILAEFMGFEDVPIERKIMFFHRYSEYQSSAREAKKFNEKLLAIRQLHIDDEITLEKVQEILRR